MWAIILQLSLFFKYFHLSKNSKNAIFRKSCWSLFFCFLLLGYGRVEAQQGPGGISSNLRIWLKADDGASNGSWTEQGPNNYVFSTVIGGGPTLVSNGLNFNPVMRFGGGTYLRRSGITDLVGGFQSRTAFVVVQNHTSSGQMYFQYGITGNNPTAYGLGISSSDKYYVDYGSSFTNPKEFVSSTNRTSDPVIFMSSYQFGNSAQIDVLCQNSSGSPGTLMTNEENPTIGATVNGSEILTGDIAEVILFESILTSTQKQQVKGYLALKYGLTLDGGTCSYLASNGSTKMWDDGKAAASTYNHDIAGVGRDDNSELSQLKSISSNSGAILTMEAQAANVGNLEFLTWANDNDDNGTIAETTTELPSGVDQRLDREWFVQEVGDVGDLTVSFNLNGIAVTGTQRADFRLLIDDDGDFSNGIVNSVIASSFSSGIVTFSGINLQDCQYIALGTFNTPKLVFSVQPSDGNVNSSISPSVEVRIVNVLDELITTATDPISLSINNNPGGGTLSGTTTVTASGGIASFNDLSIDQAGSGYTLDATATGIISATSNGFTISIQVPTKLGFHVQPSNSPFDQPIKPAVEVSILDADGVLIQNATGDITLSIQSNPASGTLSGTLTQMATSGVATFSDISIDAIGQGYTLQATSPGLSSATSNAFDITGAPGGFGNNLRLWLKADEGVIGSAPIVGWTDQGGEGNHFYSHSGNPQLVDPGLNFNPVARFDGASFLENANFHPVTGNDVRYAFAVVSNYTRTSETDNNVFQYGTNAAGMAYGMGVRVNNIDGLGYTKIGSGGGYAGISDPAILNIGIENFVGSTNIATHRLNGVSFGAASVVMENTVVGDGFRIGSQVGSNSNYFQGDISELIFYDTQFFVSPEFQDYPASYDAIVSYLAIKYGITLTQTNTAHGGYDYVSSTGSVIWDSSENTTYIHDIAAIGRDDRSELNQKQSRSQNSDGIVSIGLDEVVPDGLETTNALNTGSFTNDQSFLFWSNNGVPIDSGKQNKEFDDVLVKSRLNREWYVQETGTIGKVTVEFDVSNIIGPDSLLGTNDESQIVLMVDDDGDFSSGAQLVMPNFEPLQDGLVSFSVDLKDTDYFTLGSHEAGALPIELISFSVESRDDHLLLSWETASETDHAYFRLERAGADLNFEAFAFVEPKGSETQGASYRFMDKEAQDGMNYYRLVDVDNNGAQNYSEIISSEYYAGHPLLGVAFPNPVRRGDIVNLSTSNPDLVSKIQLISLEGRMIREFKLTDVLSKEKITFSTSALPAGVYVIRILDQFGVAHNHKLIITS